MFLGNLRRVRALIDSESQVFLILANLVRRLGLSTNTSNVLIIDIENSTSAISHGTTFIFTVAFCNGLS